MHVLVQTLIERAAAAADMHDNFVTPRQWCLWATQENLALSLFLARSGYTQNVKTQTITVTGSEAGAFPLTEAPLAIAAIHQVRDGYYRRLSHSNPVDFIQNDNLTGDPLNFRMTYDQDNDQQVLNFYPVPSAGTVLLVSYIPEPGALSLDATQGNTYVIYPMGWEERIVLGLARRALDKEESDTTAIRRQMAEMDGQIEEACWDRIITESPRVRNVDDVERGWSRTVALPAAPHWYFA